MVHLALVASKGKGRCETNPASSTRIPKPLITSFISQADKKGFNEMHNLGKPECHSSKSQIFSFQLK